MSLKYGFPFMLGPLEQRFTVKRFQMKKPVYFPNRYAMFIVNEIKSM